MKAVIAFERLVALVFACLENLIHGAVIFGWPSLVFVYLQLGYFHDLCSDRSENATSPMIPTTTTTTHNLSIVEGLESCPEQESRLQLVFSIAVAFQATCMFPVGFLFDRFGTRFSRLVMSILLLVGYILMAFSSPTYSNLVFPGTICFTIGGVIMLFSSMQIGNLFGGKKSTVITIINSMYGAAVIMLVIAKRVHDSGFSINIFFFIMAASVIPLNINTYLLLPTKYIPWPLPEGYRLISFCTPRTPSGAKEEQASASYNRGYVGDPDSDMTGVDGHYRQNGVESISSDLGRETDVSRMVKSEDISVYSISKVEERKNKEYGSLGACILSTPFFLLLLWQAFLEIDLTFTVGTLTFFLTRLSNGDEDLVSWYTDIFSITRFFVLIVGPLGGLLMDRNKLSTSCSLTKQPQERGLYADVRDSCLPLAITTFASIGYTICLLIPSLQLQYLSFILILIVGSVLFGVGSAVVAVMFPMQYFTSVYGAIRTISGFFTFLQYPIFILLQEYLNDDPFWVFVAFIVADVITLVLPAALYVRIKTRSTGDKKN